MYDNLDQRLFERLKPFGKRSSQLPGRQPRLVRRAGLYQVADGLGLCQIHPPVEKSPQRKFARFGKARPERHAQVEHPSHYYGAAVATDLDYILAGVGMGSLEESCYRLIDVFARAWRRDLANVRVV
jgi:hypothetical protein